MDTIDQLVQVAGAILILLGFVLAQMRRLDTRSIPYLGVNLVGSAVLAVDAARGGELGFLLLEGVWALVSAWGLTRRVWGWGGLWGSNP